MSGYWWSVTFDLWRFRGVLPGDRGRYLLMDLCRVDKPGVKIRLRFKWTGACGGVVVDRRTAPKFYRNVMDEFEHMQDF